MMDKKIIRNFELSIINDDIHIDSLMTYELFIRFDRDDAIALLPYLQKFVDTGEI